MVALVHQCGEASRQTLGTPTPLTTWPGDSLRRGEHGCGGRRSPRGRCSSLPRRSCHEHSGAPAPAPFSRRISRACSCTAHSCLPQSPLSSVAGTGSRGAIFLSLQAASGSGQDHCSGFWEHSLGALSGSTLGLSVLVPFPIASPWSHLQSPGEAREFPKPPAGERVGYNCQVTLI